MLFCFVFKPFKSFSTINKCKLALKAYNPYKKEKKLIKNDSRLAHNTNDKEVYRGMEIVGKHNHHNSLFSCKKGTFS